MLYSTTTEGSLITLCGVDLEDAVAMACKPENDPQSKTASIASIYRARHARL